MDITLLSVLLLSAVLIASPIVLWLDARSRRLNERVEVTIGIRQATDLATQRLGSIRLSQARQSRFPDLLYWVLRMPVGMPLAQVVPPWLVIILAIAVGLAVAWGGSYLLEDPTQAALAGVSAGFVFARTVFDWQLTRYQDKLFRQLPDAIQLVVSATRAGLPVVEAFRGVAREMPEPTREEFRQANSEILLGSTPDEALMRIHFRTRLAEYAIFAVSVGVQGRSGGKIAESVQNLAETVRQRVAIAGRAQALSAEARLSAMVMAALPFAGGIMMSMKDPHYLEPLLYDPRGKNMLLFGLSTMMLGIYVMRKIVNSVQKE
jgi:tight adherence protein B